MKLTTKILLILWAISVIVLFVVAMNANKQVVEWCEWLERSEYKICAKVYNLGKDRDEVEEKKKEAIKPFTDKQEKLNSEANHWRSEMIDWGYTPNESELVEEFIKRAEWLTDTVYELGAKTKEKLDCSGLLTVFGNEKGLISDWYMINKGNAHNLYMDKTDKKKLSELERGDILYFKNDEWPVNHIAVVWKVNYIWGYEMSIEVLDATPEHNVKKRTIILQDWMENWTKYKWYRVFAWSNPLLHFEREEALQAPPKQKTNYNPTNYWKKEDENPVSTVSKLPKADGGLSEWMYFSHYNVGDHLQNDGDACTWAWSHIVWNLCELAEQWHRTMALVSNKRAEYGVEFGDKVVLAGDEWCTGTFIVADEMNKRFRQPDNMCVKNWWSKDQHCIRWDLAYPKWVKGAGGNCYIKSIIKSS